MVIFFFITIYTTRTLLITSPSPTTSTHFSYGLPLSYFSLLVIISQNRFIYLNHYYVFHKHPDMNFFPILSPPNRTTRPPQWCLVFRTFIRCSNVQHVADKHICSNQNRIFSQHDTENGGFTIQRYRYHGRHPGYVFKNVHKTL